MNEINGVDIEMIARECEVMVLNRLDAKTKLYFIVKCLDEMNNEDFKKIHSIVVGEYLKRIR